MEETLHLFEKTVALIESLSITFSSKISRLTRPLITLYSKTNNAEIMLIEESSRLRQSVCY
jgi:hypothetical protein